MLFFGALGWVMEKMEWPRPPVLLGLVLGPLAENRLFLSTDNYGLAWTIARALSAIFAYDADRYFLSDHQKPQGSEEKSRERQARATNVG